MFLPGMTYSEINRLFTNDINNESLGKRIDNWGAKIRKNALHGYQKFPCCFQTVIETSNKNTYLVVIKLNSRASCVPKNKNHGCGIAVYGLYKNGKNQLCIYGLNLMWGYDDGRYKLLNVIQITHHALKRYAEREYKEEYSDEELIKDFVSNSGNIIKIRHYKPKFDDNGHNIMFACLCGAMMGVYDEKRKIEVVTTYISNNDMTKEKEKYSDCYNYYNQIGAREIDIKRKIVQFR